MRRLALATLLSVLASAAPASALTAPGLVTYPVGTGPQAGDDAGGAFAGVVLPDGSAVVAGTAPGMGAFAMRLSPTGAQDAAYGADGMAHVPLAPVGLHVLDVLARDDGRVVLVVAGQPAARNQGPKLLLAGLTARGERDRAFGSESFVDTGLQVGCDACRPAALAPDGAVAVTGNTTSGAPEGSSPQQFWNVARFDANGAPVTSFGRNGVLTLAGPGDTAGYHASVMPDGRITVVGTKAEKAPLVHRLLPSGSPDPAFHEGWPRQVLMDPGYGVVFDADGGVALTGRTKLVRLTPTGQTDFGFEQTGIDRPEVSLVSQLVPAADDNVLLYNTPSLTNASPTGSLLALRVSATGVATRLTAAIPLGSPSGFCCAQQGIVPQPGLAQGGFHVTRLLPRPDGTYLAIGGMRIVQYQRDGARRSVAFVTAALLDADLRLRTDYGGPPVTPTVSVQVPAQHAGTAVRRHLVPLGITTSAPGLALVNVRDGARRVLFSGVVPVFGAGASTIQVPITNVGQARLGNPRRTRITVSLALRDMTKAQGRATAVGVLR